MELNLIGALTMFKTMEMVPNFSEFARTFGRDRHTIKKMTKGMGWTDQSVSTAFWKRNGEPFTAKDDSVIAN